MAISDFWQNIVSPFGMIQDRVEPAAAPTSRSWQGAVKVWVVADAITVLLSAMLALAWERHTGAVAGDLSQGTLIRGRSLGVLLTLLSGFTFALLITSRRLHLYTPRRLASLLHEQAASLRACFTSGLLLTGTLYMIHADDIPRRLVLITVALVTVALSLRRLIYRVRLHHRFDRGIGTRDVLIVGTGPAAQALRRQLDSIRHLGYTFKGFIELDGEGVRTESECREVVGTIDTLFQHARRHFVDEIFFAQPGDRDVIKDVLEQARAHGVDLRVVPEMYDELAWKTTVEYVGQFPTIPLHCGRAPEFGLLLKRLMDLVLAGIALVVLLPALLVIAIAIKLDSTGPAFYTSERIGKKGRVFPCIKFRTMVRNAEKLREEMMHMNERDGVLFKVTNDPRITKLGRFLRKYSLDELPQLYNVLRGDMSIVGPRPPIASEVREYKLSHLRRLDVTPGITGLWQVVGRQDPSFESYISLDVTYIENWSILLDLMIIMRTVGVVLLGTGS
jgi:exopolysaccharide biosynthesis polyprenyl glycosylphosphotransferase